MPARKLFVHIWRINGLIILLIGLFGLITVGSLGFMLIKDMMRSPQVDSVANAALGDEGESRAELGTFATITGSNAIRAPLNIQHYFKSGSSSRDGGGTRNYLYFSPATRTSHWLLPSMDSVILSSNPLPQHDYREASSPALLYIHVVVSRDSNNDRQLNSNDLKDIAISTPDGKAYRVLVSAADRLADARLIDPQRLLVLYSRGSRLIAAEVDPMDVDAEVEEYEVSTALVDSHH